MERSDIRGTTDQLARAMPRFEVCPGCRFETVQEFIARFADGCTIRFMTIRSFKTGVSREQPSFLPARVEDYVDANNLVRAIEVFVDKLDLEEFGFVVPAAAGGAGQPPYHPGDLLKLYIYGYLFRIRSSPPLGP